MNVETSVSARHWHVLGTVAAACLLAACGGSDNEEVAEPEPTSPFPVAAAQAKSRCEALVGTVVGPATIRTATLVAPTTTAAGTTMAEHCRVIAYKTGKPIFETMALLPTEWIGKLVHGGGGGGLNGRLPNGSGILNQTQPLQEKLVYIASNAGNNDPSGRLLLDRETLRDYSYQHIGTTYEFGQALVEGYYANAPENNYFVGCSRGGGEAMTAAAIYPENYDGVVAQAPAPEMLAWYFALRQAAI